MNKASKKLFLLVACIAPIFIGIIHTLTHFTYLLSEEIHIFLQREFMILGELQSLWNTWGIVSFMMGCSFIIIGLLNISMLRKLQSDESIPIFSLIAMALYQICVTYVGYEFSQDFQLYGGFGGFVVILLCLFLSKSHIKQHA